MEEVERRESSTRRSSAAITGCQLAKKSNARLPSLCDAMLMVCRCLFSTRCLHTWLDPRGISEMFLAPIRNHILLPFIPLAVPSAARRSLSLSLSSFPSILPLPHPRLRLVELVAFVVLDRPSLTPTTSRPAFSALFRRAYPAKFVSVPRLFIRPRSNLRPVSVAQPSRRVCHAKARANVLIIILDGRN